MKLRRSRFIALVFAAAVGIAVGALFADSLPAPDVFRGSDSYGLARFICAAVYNAVKPLLLMLAAGYTVYAMPVSLAVTAITAARAASCFAQRFGDGINAAGIAAALLCAAAVYLCLCAAARTTRFSLAIRCGLTDAKSAFFSRPSARYLSDMLTLTGMFMAVAAAIFFLL